MLHDNPPHLGILPIVTPKLSPHPSFSVSAGQKGMFSHDVLLDSHGYVERRATNCLVSILLHGVLAGLLVLLSLVNPVTMRLHPRTRTVLVMPLVNARVPLPAHERLIDPANSIFFALTFSPPLFSVPDHAADSFAPPPDVHASESFDQALGNLLRAAAMNSANSILPPLPAGNFRLVHMGGEVRSSRPLSRLVLVYPELARAAHVFGKVVIRAIIDKSGKVIEARAVEGPALLYAAAVDAVSKERFVPVLLNGEPTKCDLTVEVNFALNSRY